MVTIEAKDPAKVVSGPTRKPLEEDPIEEEVSFQTKEEFEKNKGKDERGTEVFG